VLCEKLHKSWFAIPPVNDHPISAISNNIAVEPLSCPPRPIRNRPLPIHQILLHGTLQAILEPLGRFGGSGGTCKTLLPAPLTKPV
jgi:hypothetical protein